MERTSTGHSHNRASDRFLLFAIAAAVAAFVTATLVTVLLLRDSGEGTSTSTIETPNAASGFVLFDDFHATLLLAPGRVGENRLDLAIARHDGTAVEDVSRVTVAVSQDGERIRELEATPAGSPGTYTVSGLSIPSAGEWEFELSVATTSSEPVSKTTVITLGAPTDN